MEGETPALLVSNRSYRYGDGLFETMRITNAVISLADYHFERLFASLSILKYDIPSLFTRELISQQVDRRFVKKTNAKSRQGCAYLFPGAMVVYLMTTVN